MKWFKHFSSNAIQDPQLTRLLDDLGVEAYGRYNLMIECLVRGAEAFETAPKADFTAKRWAEVLRLKPKTVKTFLEQMQLIGVIKFVCSQNGFTVELLNYKRLLSKTAVSSQKRSTTGAPRVEKNTYSALDLNRDKSIKARQDNLANNPILALAAQSSPEAKEAFLALVKTGGSAS